MNTFIHDVDLGKKPDTRALHQALLNASHSPLLMGIMHYLRDEAAHCIGRSTEAMRNGEKDAPQMELGAHEILVQVFSKFNTMRLTPLEIEPEA